MPNRPLVAAAAVTTAIAVGYLLSGTLTNVRLDNYEEQRMPAGMPAWMWEDPQPPMPCQEDMPCWDCRTMGNDVCGVTTSFSLPSN